MSRISAAGIATGEHGGNGVAPAWARLAELVGRAVDDCFDGRAPPADLPLVLASCNGGADGDDASAWENAFSSRTLLAQTAFADRDVPVVSTSCTSGLHALLLACRAEVPDVLVIAADVASAVNHRHFEALRVLASERGIPWTEASSGFVQGEAAVALRVSPAGDGPSLRGPVAGLELERCVAPLATPPPRVVLGQGTGPAAADFAELASVAAHVPTHVPIASALWAHGHTLGAASLLPLAMAALGRPVPMPRGRASDGRPFAVGDELGDALVVCRALGGGSAAARIARTRPAAAPAPGRPRFQPPRRPPALHTPWLRDLVAEARARRPDEPPDLLLVTLDEPVLPPRDAALARCPLPSAILEMTPGFVGNLVAAAWGFDGPVVTLVRPSGRSLDSDPILRRCIASVARVQSIHVHGRGQGRRVAWR